MNSRNKCLLTACFLCWPLAGIHIATAQNQAFVFKHLSTENGLSQSTVHAIYQDKLGFMWFGTNIGVNKFDGSKFTVYQYKTEDTNSISSNFIVQLLEDSYGNLWLGTGYSGLNRFDRKKEIFYRYEHNPAKGGSISSDNIRAIFEDSRKNLWIGTAGGGLNLYDRESDSFIHFLHDSLSNSDIGTNYISSISEDKNGYLWFGSQEGILVKYDAKTGKGQSFKLFGDYRADLFNTTFSQVYIDSKNNVWFGTENGLYFYDQQSREFKHFVKGQTPWNLNANAVASILEKDNGVYLISTDHGGLNIYNSRNGTFTYQLSSKLDESSLSNNQLYSIYRSSDGIIWIGTFQGGLNILDEKSQKFRQFKDLLEPSESLKNRNSVLTICEDKDNNIWIGNDGQGITVIDPIKFKIKHMLKDANHPNSIPGNIVTEIYRDRQDDLWIGTYMEGMSRLDWKTKRYTHYRHNTKNSNSLCGNNVWTILEDKAGFLWIGTMGNGMDRFDRRTNTFKHFRSDPDDSTSLSNNDVFKIYEDNKEQIWVGTRNGLCLLNKESGGFTRYMSGAENKNGLRGGWIYDIYQDRLGNLWIGTDQTLNLFHPESNTFESLQEQYGLNGGAILAIVSDERDNLWISTNKGLTRFNVKENKFRNYDVTDGLQGKEFNYTSVLFSHDGRLYFGGKSGLNIFHPDSIKDNTLVPPVYLTGLTVLNTPIHPRDKTSILTKNITFEQKITLTHKQSVFTLEFAALNFSNPEKNQYAYWLEGFDNQWNYIGNKHEVTYTNLNPGRYLFKVKGSNNDGVWNENGASLEIIVLPPWWKTWWFRTLFYILVAGMLVMFYSISIAFYRSHQRKLSLLVKERTLQIEEVATTLEEKQEEINSQNEELMAQRDELEKANTLLTEQKQQILDQNKELDEHRNRLEYLVEERTRELILAKNKAVESDRLKSSFLANLSHEIRTPLNAILGFSTLLGEKELSDNEREEYNSIIQSSSNTLLDLISDILDISKIEAGQLEIDLHEVSLESVLNDTVEIFNLLIKRQDIGSNKNLLLKVILPNELRKIQVITDKLRLEQILSNLISNAIKFTRQGYVEVGCRKLIDRGMMEFYVKDTGTGIKEENQQVIFERFRKVEEDKTYLHRGAGLGLAISSQLINLLGGTISLSSKPGEGSVFYFTIPLIKSDSPYNPILKARISDRIPDFKNLCVMVAEDDMFNFKYIERILKKAGLKVVHAENGSQVLSMLKKPNDIKLILLDIKMPGMDGIETLHEIRKMNVTLPVIAQTAYALADEVGKFRKEGFDDYIAKPLSVDNLYFMIEKYLKPSDRLDG